MNPCHRAAWFLGPEPWNVVYVEPSFRADDGGTPTTQTACRCTLRCRLS